MDEAVVAPGMTSNLDNYVATADTCVAIGIFDGVHRGHQAVLDQTREAAQERDLVPVGLTFDPHPTELLAPERAPMYLCSLSQRVEWMTRPNLVRDVVVAHFDREFSEWSARDFVEKVLVERLRAKEIRVGADFRFGKGRQGSVMDLESMGDRCGFRVSLVHSVSRGSERISSTNIRKLVAQGDLGEAGMLLGRPFTLRGIVVEGKKLGRTIGYPTANIEPATARQLLPANGVYAGTAVLGEGASTIRAAISVGVNPTTDGENANRKVEAYLMEGFNRDLYGQTVDLRFVEKIRDEMKFDSLDELVKQIDDDVAIIEQHLSKQ